MTDRSLGVPVDLGAGWIHDHRGNPLSAVARESGITTVTTDYERLELRRPGGSSVAAADLAAALEAQEAVMEEIAEAAASADPGDRLAPLLAQARRRTGLTGVRRTTLDWLLGNDIPLDLGADAGELSLVAFDEGETYRGGGDRLLRGGAAQLVEAVASGTVVRRSAPVTRVSRSGDGVTVELASGEQISADGCVLTVPLGVLKAGGIEFTPLLPVAMRRAIEHIAVGLLNKVVLRYPEAMWEPGTQLGVVGDTIGRTVGVFDYQAVTEAPIVAAFVGASHARALERLEDGEVVSAVTDQLARGFGAEARQPESSIVTRWGADPWARGSYSFLPPRASSRDRQALGQPAGRLVLAGEHTSVERPATMDGALRSGQRAARSMLAALDS